MILTPEEKRIYDERIKGKPFGECRTFREKIERAVILVNYYNLLCDKLIPEAEKILNIGAVFSAD